jgi:hypothetical protein
VKWLHAELLVTLTRQDRVEHASFGVPEVDPVSMPFHGSASTAITSLGKVLGKWVDLVSRSAGDTTTGALPVAISRHGTPLYAEWLIERLRWLRRLPDAAIAFEEITREVDHATRVIDRPADLAYGGPCGARNPETGDECPEVIWARPGTRLIQCRRCGATWDFQARRTNALKAAEDRLESPETIARALTSMGMPLTFDRIRQWRRRGQLVPARVDDRGRARYRLGDVMDLWARMERRT